MNPLTNTDTSQNAVVLKSFFFLKRKIKIRRAKCIEIDLISLKDNLLNNIQEEILKMFSGIESNLNVNITKIKKEKNNLDIFEAKKKQFDFTFIIHKIEGRLFLLGKNGFYNKIVEELRRKINRNIFFILVFQNITEESNDSFINSILNDLIQKGEQQDLIWFKKNNHIFFINDFNFKDDFVHHREIFKELFLDSYRIFHEEENASRLDILLEKENGLNEDIKFIESVCNIIYNGENENIFSKCNMI